MAKLPAKVKVGGIIYNVRLVDEMGEAFGKHYSIKSLIEIANGSSKDQERSTVIHELLHAVLLERGISRGFLSPEKEEELISALEGGLYALIRDNPKLIQYLIAKD